MNPVELQVKTDSGFRTGVTGLAFLFFFFVLVDLGRSVVHSQGV